MIAHASDRFETGLAHYATTLPEHISPTAAKSYLACSLRFYFERVAYLKKPTPKNLHLGKAVHAALQAFLYAFPESGSVYQPVYLGRRNDIEPRECVTTQLKYKPSTAGEAA